MKKQIGLILLSLSVVSACSKNTTKSSSTSEAVATPEAAKAFWDSYEKESEVLDVKVNLAQWAAMTNITDETEKVASASNEEYMAFNSRTFKEAMKYKDVKGDAALERALGFLTSAPYVPSPDNDAKRKELAEIMTKMEGMYGKGEYCTGDGDKKSCRDLGELSEVLKSSRNYDELLEAWNGWRTVSPQMKPLYSRFVELANEGAKEMGLEDTGAGWRSWYDMSTEDFSQTVDRLYSEVEPLYKDLHCYAREQLSQKYPGKMKADGAIPAHLLGNMWAQGWENIYDIMQPYASKTNIDIDGELVKQGYDAIKMVKAGESFFTSLGMKSLPDSFWTNSMFVQPEDRDVVCHASAWDVTNDDDVRIKMCIKQNEEDLITIHHELGHIYYYLYYNNLPNVFQGGAHDGFHEAIGDAIALSMTNDYYNKIGLLDRVPEQNEKELINAQMRRALEKIAFLPFGRMIDQWRWDVFSGKVGPDDYNGHWWKLRKQFQGVESPNVRPAEAFDPGAKYHIPGNTPYVRYFLSFILQFQMHKALCDAAGFEGPLNECSIHGSKEAGEKMMALLSMGKSKPWQDALEAMTGTRDMSAGALLEYFAPLRTFLAEQNKGKQCGW